MTKRPYLKLWKSDFRDGARMLSRPAKLLYFELIMLLDDHNGRVQDDAKWIAKNIGAHDARAVRGPLEELVGEGKIWRRGGWLYNPRVARDHVVEPEAEAVEAEPDLFTEAVDNPVDEVGTDESLRSHCAPTVAPLSSDRAQSNAQVIDFPRRSQPPNHSHSHSHESEVAAVGTRSPRARDGPPDG